MAFFGTLTLSLVFCVLVTILLNVHCIPPTHAWYKMRMLVLEPFIHCLKGL